MDHGSHSEGMPTGASTGTEDHRQYEQPIAGSERSGYSRQADPPDCCQHQRPLPSEAVGHDSGRHVEQTRYGGPDSEHQAYQSRAQARTAKDDGRSEKIEASADPVHCGVARGKGSEIEKTLFFGYGQVVTPVEVWRIILVAVELVHPETG